MSELDRHAAICAACPSRCESVCPAFIGSGRSDRSPRAMLLRAAAEPDATAALFCVGCGVCTTVCDAEQPMAALLEAARGPAARALGVEVDAARVDAMVAGWRAYAGASAKTAFVATCGCGSPGLPADQLEAKLEQIGARGALVLRDVDCGRKLASRGQDEAFARLTDAIADALAGVRSIVAPGAACTAAFTDHAERGGLVAIYTATLDSWLARYGVSLPGRTTRLRPCLLQRGERRTERETEAPGSAIWPAAAVCCGAHGPLGELAPEVAHAAAVALVGRLVEDGVTVLHVEDAHCRAHLLRAVESAQAPLRIVDRASLWLSDPPSGETA